MAMKLFTAKQYLKIDIANSFGKDKENWDQRINWFDTHEAELEKLLNQAEEPALFFAGVQAWRAVQRGEPIGYPISLDATSSGMQILAALTGDRSAASLCNVIDVGQRMDAYRAIYLEMVNRVGESAKIDRSETKRAIMTSFYSSEAVPKEVFGTGALLGVFEETMSDAAPAAWELNKAFLQMWNPEAHSHDWVLPDNFHVQVKVMKKNNETVHFLNKGYKTYFKTNEPMQGGRSLGANTIHSLDGMIVREITRRCDYDVQQVFRVRQALDRCNPSGQPRIDADTAMVRILWKHYEESGYLSARILDHLHEYNAMLVDKAVLLELLDSLPKKPFKVLAVHDCFRVLPNYGNDLRIQYNIQLMLIARSNLLGFLLSQITGRNIVINKLHPDLYKEIMESNYALS